MRSSWPHCKQHREDTDQTADLIKPPELLSKLSKVKALGGALENPGPSRGRVFSGLQTESKVL